MIKVDNICFSYSSKRILDEVGFDVPAGKIITILGPNGVGKTTLLKCLNRILKASEGTVFVENEDVLTLNRLEVAKKMGYVSQKSETTRVTVFDAVLLGRKPHIKWNVTEEDIALVDEVIDRVGLGDLALSYVDEISGGEYQKVQIARALVQEPRVLLLDEPTSNLDLRNQHLVMDIVAETVRKNNLSAVVTMHDLNLSLRYSDRFVMMKENRVFATGDFEIITPENIEAVYGISASVETVRGVPIVVPF